MFYRLLSKNLVSDFFVKVIAYAAVINEKQDSQSCRLVRIKCEHRANIVQV